MTAATKPGAVSPSIPVEDAARDGVASREAVARNEGAVTRTAAAAVTGAAHLRLARNGQDAVARWSEGRRGVVVVCDGCGSGASSELGAIFTARALCAALARRLTAGEPAAEPATWEAARRDVVQALTRLAGSWMLEADDAPLAALVEQHLLCTVVAAARDERGAAVWAIGDGAYVLGGELTALGPFADNAPPYLAYELLGVAPRAHFATRRPGDHDAPDALDEPGAILVATDGAAALGEALLAFVEPPALVYLLSHPDALRRRLATLARPAERIVWSERRVERAAATLQDDAAIALLAWGDAAAARGWS